MTHDTTDPVAQMRDIAQEAINSLEWCARDGRMASPNLHQHPAKWAAEFQARLGALPSPPQLRADGGEG